MDRFADRRVAGLVAVSVILIVVAVMVGRGGSDEDDLTGGAGSYRPPASTSTTSTLPVTTTTAEVTQATVVDDDFNAAESANEGRDDHSVAPDYDGPGEPISFEGVDRSDPQAVAAAWGCAYRSAPIGEPGDTWAFRMNQMTTQRGAAKLATLRAFDADSDTRAFLISAVDMGEGLFRVQCATKTFSAEKVLVDEDLIGVVWVKVVNEDGAWSVDDFAQGGLGLDS